MEEALVKQFSEQKSKEKVQEFYEKTLSILTSALDDLRKKYKKNSLDYDDTRIFPMGDYTNDTFIDQTGELEIVIATSNPNIKIANATYLKSLKEAKNKKQKSNISNEGTFDCIITNYLQCLSEYFDNTTMLLLINQGIKILCIEEFGFKILIRFATYDEEDKDAILSFWDPMLKRIKKTNLFLYNEKMDEKDKLTNGNYKKLVRIFKNIRKNILMSKWALSSDLNKYFIELIVFNIPNSIMQEDNINVVFDKCVNYLDNCNVISFTSFDGNKIDSFDLAKVSYSKIKNFINYVVKISY